MHRLHASAGGEYRTTWEPMKSWHGLELDLKPRLPEILSSNEDARAVVLAGEVEVTTAAGERAAGGVGLVVELSPRERHEVLAGSNARLLMVLTPWPGRGHPGAMTITQKLYARRHAAKQRK